ncbi:polysaccharide biosynthesis/export family protein [Anianabacter salinae]|uniref:polysaccharide biosynthesis/export family protein n=1 Tax=Anianabacter salinae TaxID=2851023 RepID=UPI00225E583A|nr:polysaccharide biosynthesis/export family protein [Anianabacter salinae]MBV0913457.1 polysaccharide biosynthesis/export family protein [Anianabacter salinae]
MLKHGVIGVALLALAGCGVAYISPSVQETAGTDAKVRVVKLTPETVLVANRSTYRPSTLPSVFYANAGTGGGLRGAGAVPDPAYEPEARPGSIQTRVPQEPPRGPYEIGIGDVLLLATPAGSTSVEELTGLLAAQNRRQGYTVQDDGTIAIPDVGRVDVAGMTLEQAEGEIFQALVQNQIDPTFSLEVAEFNSRRVAVGGAVRQPTVVPIQLTPLYLDEALIVAGGTQVTDEDFASIRLYRDGTIYQIALSEFQSRPDLQRLRLVDGDSVFVDTSYQIDRAAAYFQQQLQIAEFRQASRNAALAQLETEVSLRRAALEEERSNFERRLSADGVDRDYVYVVGELVSQNRFVLPFDQSVSLADALYDEGGFEVENANPGQIYVLRGSTEPSEFGAVTAWHLDARNAVNFVLATRMELRPNDVIFVAEQPITKWNRAISQSIPSLFTSVAAAAR